MLAVLGAVAWLLAGILVLALILLAVLLWGPVRFAGHGKVRVEGDPDATLMPSGAEFHGQVSLLWGAVQASDAGVRFLWWTGGMGRRSQRSQPVLPTQPAQRSDISPPSASDQPAPKRRRRSPWPKLTWQQVRALLPQVKEALARTWAALHLRAQADIVLGLDDPAATGIVAGAIPAAGYALTARANARRPGSITYTFRPVFDREVLAAEFRLTGRTTLGSLAWPWLRLALQPDVRRLWWPPRRRNSKGGESNDVQ